MESCKLRVIRYVIIGWVVAIACLAIPKHWLAIEEVAMISLIASATYSIVDTYVK